MRSMPYSLEQHLNPHVWRCGDTRSHYVDTFVLRLDPFSHFVNMVLVYRIYES
jgi:hypothetical protein